MNTLKCLFCRLTQHRKYCKRLSRIAMYENLAMQE